MLNLLKKSFLYFLVTVTFALCSSVCSSIRRGRLITLSEGTRSSVAMPVGYLERHNLSFNKMGCIIYCDLCLNCVQNISHNEVPLQCF